MAVDPDSFSGYSMSLMGIFGKGPKFTITCGGCHATFNQRIPVVDNPGVVCPHCQEVNILPLIVSLGEDEKA